jgi:hypothetical protein
VDFFDGALMKCKNCATEHYVQHTPIPVCPVCFHENSFWLAYHPMRGQRENELPN